MKLELSEKEVKRVLISF